MTGVRAVLIDPFVWVRVPQRRRRAGIRFDPGTPYSERVTTGVLMSAVVAASEVVLPRRDTLITAQQERFVLRYLVDLDRHAALKEAGYNPTTPESADSMASNLLSNVKVRAFLFEKKAEYAAAYKIDAVKWLAQLQLVAMEAYTKEDWAGAVSALREIGRHLGVYEKDLRQRHFTAEDVEKLEAELRSRGFDPRRVNAPPVMANDPNAVSTPVVVEKPRE